MDAIAQTAAECAAADRGAEIWAALSTVVDPELDEPVTDMGFISRVEVDANDHVHVDFRLPTYWCAANFAFMMAADMRDVLLAVPWITGTTIVLGDHMYTDKINKGIAEGLSFEDTFGDEATGNLDEVRQTFLVKAFQRRQEALMRHLLDLGRSAEDVAGITVAALRSSSTDGDGPKLIERYMQRRGVIGPYLDLSPAFVTAEGQRITGDAMGPYLAGLRRIRANAEFNGALCRGLLAVRFDMETPLAPRPPKACQAASAAAEHSTTGP
ncbi:MAG: iron-sulfur cluster assembly protein [Hyphomicrobium sp.]